MNGLNLQIFTALFSFAHRSVFLDGVVVFFAEYFPYLLVLGFLIIVMVTKGKRLRLLLLGETALALLLSRGILTEGIRYFYYHPRPFDALQITSLVGESGSSFPSGHAAFFFALATVLFFFWRKAGTWYFVFAAINGIARIIAGVHWPLDIVGGAAVGVLSGVIVWITFSGAFKKIAGSSDTGALGVAARGGGGGGAT